MLLIVHTCVSSHRGPQDFVASLKGKLVFTDSQINGSWSVLDFSGDSANIEHTNESTFGILSPDKEWELLFIREEDTNGDGVIDSRDQSSLYLSEVGSSKKEQVDLPFPVGMCAWGTEYMIAVCSFTAMDVIPNEMQAGYNSVIYVVDLETGDLLRCLSDPAKTSWSPTWSPDGGLVAFEIGIRNGRRLEEQGIQIVDAQSGELVHEITESSSEDPVWSPDGTKLAFIASLESGKYSEAKVEHMYRDVFYIDLRDESFTIANVTQTSRFSEIPAPLTELGGIWVSQPVWAPSGDVIASVWEQNSGDQIWVTSVDGNEWAQVTKGSGHQYYLIEWQP
jgi:Tol biopolymer transport system component